MTNQNDNRDEHVARHVGLALRSHRRKLGLSQRGYATRRGISRGQLAKMESDASAVTLRAITDALEGTGFSLAIVQEGTAPAIPWDSTDLEARTRGGGRFPANRQVRKCRSWPFWWEYHEMMGTGDCGPQPRWTAEGFPNPGTRFGKPPKARPKWDGTDRVLTDDGSDNVTFLHDGSDNVTFLHEDSKDFSLSDDEVVDFGRSLPGRETGPRQ
ncbi:MAG TPA: helix-turn-helix transcriptional regulator [Actinomycetaceae bacterium]|nr:helix-turn-helix transcriptional regulator [Actinomycetaceae bacterium]